MNTLLINAHNATINAANAKHTATYTAPDETAECIYRYTIARQDNQSEEVLTQLFEQYLEAKDAEDKALKEWHILEDVKDEVCKQLAEIQFEQKIII